MKIQSSIHIIFVMVFLILGGCSVSDSNHEDTAPTVERTLPHALSLRTTTIQQLRNETTPPDSVNLDVFITAINVCPEDASCFIPDGIFVAESAEPDSSDERFYFSVLEPQQFETGQFYLLSVKIKRNESGNRTFFDLLGYSKIKYELYGQ